MILGAVKLRKVVRSFSTSDGAVYASHEVIEGLPRRQLVGYELHDITLNCHFHQAIINIWETHDALVSLKESGQLVELQSDNGETWGSYVVMKVTMKPTAMLPDETVIAADVDIELGDPGKRDDVVPDPVAVTGAPNAKSDPAVEDRSTAPGDFTAAQIARRE